MGHRLDLVFRRPKMDTNSSMDKTAALCAAAAAHGGFLAVHGHSHIPSWIRAVYAPTRRAQAPFDTMGKGRAPRDGRPDLEAPPQAKTDAHYDLWERYSGKAALALEDIDKDFFRDQPRALFHAHGWALCFEGAPNGAPWGTEQWYTPNAVLLHAPTSAHDALRLHKMVAEDLDAARRFLPWMAAWWDDVDAVAVHVTHTLSP